MVRLCSRDALSEALSCQVAEQNARPCTRKKSHVECPFCCAKLGLDTNNRYIRIRIRKILDLRMRIRIKKSIIRRYSYYS